MPVDLSYGPVADLGWLSLGGGALVSWGVRLPANVSHFAVVGSWSGARRPGLVSSSSCVPGQDCAVGHGAAKWLSG